MHARHFQQSPGCSHGSSSNAATAPNARPFSRVTCQRQSVICMAHPRRVAKVASQIQREISEMFIYDKIVQEAICPERRRGLDDQLSAVASITDVYVSGDLQVVKVYVSVYSDTEGKERAINNLKRIAPYVRSRIGQAVRLRLTPEIRFVHDNTLDEIDKIQEAIGKEDFERYIAEAEAEAAGLPAPSSSNSSSGSEAAAGFGPGQAGEDNDDSGFFDIVDEADGDASGDPAAESSSSNSSSSDGGRRKVAWSRQDPETFFAVDVDELELADRREKWYSRNGPFDDLFRGASEGELAQPRSSKGGSRGGKKRQQARRQ